MGDQVDEVNSSKEEKERYCCNCKYNIRLCRLPQPETLDCSKFEKRRTYLRQNSN